jgi:trk system potassium uptake protein TrkA
MGACVTLTDIDEKNILISMYAATLGLGKVITKVNRTPFKNMLSHIGLESIVSPKATTANRILRYVRAMQNAADSNNVQTLYKLVDNRVEALEFRVGANTAFSGVPLKGLRLKKNLLIAGIVRRGELIIPSGDDTIEQMDSVIVVTMGEYLRDLDDILKP